MKHQPLSLKIGSNMFTEQMKWTAWFIGITFIIHIVQIVANHFGTRSDEGGVTDYFLSSHISGNIYMLIIGIIAAYAFLPFFVQNGLTRKDVLKGSILAAIGLSIVLPIITYIVSLFTGWIVDIANLAVTFKELPIFTADDATEHMIGAIIIATLDAPTAIDRNFGLALLLNSLNLFFFYIIGYLITTGFYRFNWIIGLGYVFLSIILVSIRSMLWGTVALENTGQVLQIGDIQLSTIGFVIASIILSIIVILIIRLTTKRITIKL